MNEHINFPLKFRSSKKFVDTLQDCEAGLYEDVLADRESGIDNAQEPVVGDFIERHKTVIEVRDNEELVALKWALESGTTSVYMDRAVFQMLNKINLALQGRPHEVPKPSRRRVKDKNIIEGHEIEKHVKGIAKLMQRNIDEIVPLNIRTVRYLSKVPYTIWRRDGSYSSGRANSSHVHLTLGSKLSDALHVIIHEMCHALIGGKHGHNRVFKTTHRSAHRLFNESNYRQQHNLPEAIIR